MVTKTITVSITSEEVDALEDVLFCELSVEQRTKLFPHFEALWGKLASEFDKKEEQTK